MADPATASSPATTHDTIIGKTTDNTQIHSGVIVPEAYTTVVVIIITAIMIVSFIGNVLALSSMARNRKNIYPWFFNLALADLVQTVCCMPYSVYLTSYYENKQTFDYQQFSCTLFGYIFHLILLMGLVSNTCVALDRVHATYFPFHYSSQQRRFPPHYKIVGVWVVVAALAALPFYLQTDKTVYPPFGLQEYVPMCVFDIRNMFDIKYPRKKMDVLITLYYFALYGIPIIIIISSTCLVMVKLFPKVLAERKHNITAKSLVISNTSAVLDEHALTRIGDDQVIRTDDTSRYPPIPRHGRRGVEEATGEEARVEEVEKESVASVDALVKLHSSAKSSSSSRKTKQWRAIQTMLIVSVAFVVCHMNHVMYWVLYEITGMAEFDRKVSISLTGGGPSMAEKIGYTSLKTSQIIMVYVDCVINVIVYYNRCTLLRESMADQARRIITLITKPIFRLLSNLRKN